ncbi:MAG: TatD family hydrolase, partial [Rickettsiales bacterium]|nr:TatD family hydrolase [Rickettsiales bacterium]
QYHYDYNQDFDEHNWQEDGDNVYYQDEFTEYHNKEEEQAYDDNFDHDADYYYAATDGQSTVVHGFDVSEFDEVYGIAERFAGVYCSVGVHPNDSGKTDIVSHEELVRLSARPKVIGLGETGLDYHYDTSDRASQRASFLEHIQASRVTGLPLIIHTRAAVEDPVPLLTEEMGKGAFTGVIHCFTSSKMLADACVALGFYISLSGIITFKNAQAIRDAIADVPPDRLLVETDAPFLAPVPYRGKTNEPSFVPHTNAMLASLKGISAEACASLTTENFFRLFNRAKPAEAVCA